MPSRIFRAAAFCLLSILYCLPALAAPPDERGQANPGSLNYVEGQAFLDGKPLDPNSSGTVQLAAGQTLETQDGKVEILLDPGVFVRLGDDSCIRMISPAPHRTRLLLQSGRAAVEIVGLGPGNLVVIDMPDSSTQLLQEGFYDFDANLGRLRVFSGHATLTSGNSLFEVFDAHGVDVKSAGVGQDFKFSADEYDEDDLDRWSDARSAYLAEANQDLVSQHKKQPKKVAGWYWDPWSGAFTYFPDFDVLYSPFGGAFYSLQDSTVPLFVYHRHHHHHHHENRSFSSSTRPAGGGNTRSSTGARPAFLGVRGGHIYAANASGAVRGSSSSFGAPHGSAGFSGNSGSRATGGGGNWGGASGTSHGGGSSAASVGAGGGGAHTGGARP